jgi:hypothetical protein
MNLIIAGSRGFNDYGHFKTIMYHYLQEHPEITTIISGMANGADKLGARYAKLIGLKLIEMPANWKDHGKSAGYKRNEEMAKIAQYCICFWDGKSKGTGHMIDLAKEYKLELKIVKY